MIKSKPVGKNVRFIQLQRKDRSLPAGHKRGKASLGMLPFRLIRNILNFDKLSEARFTLLFKKPNKYLFLLDCNLLKNTHSLLKNGDGTKKLIFICYLCTCCV